MADQPQQLSIRIKRFFAKPKEETVKEVKQVPVPDGKGGLSLAEVTEYRKTGKMITEDWVEYAPPGQLDRSVTREKIADIMKIKKSDAEHHPAADMQFEFREYIMKHYAAWKQGQDVPVDGTPLSAWNALDVEMADAFKRAGLRTVEEIAEMNDSVLSKVHVPRPRELKALAKRFLDAADQNRAAAEIKRRDDEMESLKAQISELQQRVAAPPPKKTLTMPKQTEAAA